MQRELDVSQLADADLGERARPEDLAEDRRVLKQALALGRKRVESRCDQGLHALGEHELVGVDAAVCEEPDELLRVERVASRALEDRLLELRAEHRRQM